jgi:hypothetical protein
MLVNVHNSLSKVFEFNANFLSHIIIDDFNINMFDQNSTQPNGLKIFMKQYSMELQFLKNTTIYGSHINHIWTNPPTQECMSKVIEAYWIDHKPIYFCIQTKLFLVMGQSILAPFREKKEKRKKCG